MEFDCTKCGRRLGAHDEHAGMTTKCPGCGAKQIIPHPSAPASVPSPPAGGAAAPVPAQGPARRVTVSMGRPKGSSPWLIRFLIAVPAFVVFVGGGVAALWLVRSRADERDFGRACQEDTAAAYLQYVLAHPSGSHATEAKALQADHDDLEKARSGGKASDFEAYAAAHPGGKHVEEAKRRIEEIKAAEAAAASKAKAEAERKRREEERRRRLAIEAARRRKSYVDCGPWRFSLKSVRTGASHSVRAGAGTVSVRPIERGNTLLFVALQAKRLRGYTGTEEAKMRRHSGYSAILKGRALFETQMLISSKDFILTYFAKYRGSMKLNMSLCRAMDCGRGINQLTFTGDDAVLGYVQGSGGDVTLVFDYSTRDPNPVLNIMPHPGGSLDKAIRMPVRTGGHPAEYGTLADMKKYIPGELLKK